MSSQRMWLRHLIPMQYLLQNLQFTCLEINSLGKGRTQMLPSSLFSRSLQNLLNLLSMYPFHDMKSPLVLAIIEIYKKCLYFLRMSTGANRSFHFLTPFWIYSTVLQAYLNSRRMILSVVFDTEWEAFMTGKTGVMMVIQVFQFQTRDSFQSTTGISHVHLEQIQKNLDSNFKGEQLGYNSMILANRTVQPIPPTQENICKQTPLFLAHILMAFKVTLNTQWLLVLDSRQAMILHPFRLFFSLYQTNSRTGLSNSKSDSRIFSGIRLRRMSNCTLCNLSLISGIKAVGIGNTQDTLGLVDNSEISPPKKCYYRSTQGGTMHTASMSLSLLLTPNRQLPNISSPHLLLMLGLIFSNQVLTIPLSQAKAISFVSLDLLVSLQSISNMLWTISISFQMYYDLAFVITE